jgi:predicted Zn-ribbon and HTH transcriptional regulator|tara:strand:- start:1807 stop:2685 length:879 start_codon:yes stop_codon:yes gene_type:complete
MSSNQFPINPFIDVDPKSFHSRNKKHVSEDFVSENFKNINWEVSKPFNDTGIDLIISRFVCSKDPSHTKFNEKNINSNCEVCKSNSIKIYRFIQVKTREIKNNIFGYTLSPKDFRTDPRHIFLFYSDHTEDFLSISIFDYLNFFKDNNIDRFKGFSFNQGNGKVNSLKYNETDKNWNYLGHSWEKYTNQKGIINFQNRDFDIHLNDYQKKIVSLKKELFYGFSTGRTFNFDESDKLIIQKEIDNNYIKKNSSHFKNLINNYISKMKKQPQTVIDSAKKYLIEYKDLYDRFRN